MFPDFGALGIVYAGGYPPLVVCF